MQPHRCIAMLAQEAELILRLIGASAACSNCPEQ